MKNIHVLPTDKPSKLYYNTKGKNYAFSNAILSQGGCVENQHIYITDDSEIKDGDYGICLNLVREGFKSHQAVFKMDLEQRQAMEDLGGQKKAEVLKIILTTDPELIKDGVQEIPDEFLEWFVKNPSCEFVEIRYNVGTYNPDYLKFYEVSPPKSYYKIIIPKEEPKQETFEEFAENYLNKFYSNYAFKDLLKPLLIDGAKWQQERMYSEEEVRKAIKLYSHIDNELSIGEILQQFKKK